MHIKRLRLVKSNNQSTSTPSTSACVRTAGVAVVEAVGEGAGALAAGAVCGVAATGGVAAAADRSGAEAGDVCALANPAHSSSAATTHATLRTLPICARLDICHKKPPPTCDK